jgi:hypothetical protein
MVFGYPVVLAYIYTYIYMYIIYIHTNIYIYIYHIYIYIYSNCPNVTPFRNIQQQGKEEAEKLLDHHHGTVNNLPSCAPDPEMTSQRDLDLLALMNFESSTWVWYERDPGNSLNSRNDSRVATVVSPIFAQ